MQHPELGPPPTPPTGQWAIDMGRAVPESTFVQAELVERVEADEEEEGGSTFGDAMRQAFGTPMLDSVII